MLSANQSLLNGANIQITVSQQTVAKDFDDNKKPYTEYILNITYNKKTWKVAKRYKQFNELQQVVLL